MSNLPSLKYRLNGTWRLESYVTLPTPSSAVQRPTYPMSNNVKGLLIYTSDGYMSVQLLIPGQVDFDDTSDADRAEAGKRSFTYAGPFYITRDSTSGQEILHHQFELCSLPTRVGDVESRSYRFEEDGQVLVLGGKETTVIKGDERIPVLSWRRVEDNTGAQPPVAVPEIKLG